MSRSTVLDRLRQPEFTGPNRCLPCTAVNVAIAALLSVGVAAAAVLAGGGPAVAATAAGATALLSATAIYLRGYLVPGTPALTEAYLPDRIRRRFHDRPTAIDREETADLALRGVAANARRGRSTDGTGDDEDADDEPR